jgi:uncharacterized membrane protein YeaQ/YmgE (transglycosylase-associated protein family)
MGLIAWVILGAIAGWIASKINGTDDQQGWIMNIVLGIGGALLGGFLWSLITDQDDVIGFNIGSLILAIIGALILSWAVGFFMKRRA